MRKEPSGPLLVLALARSFSSVTCHMIGQHPEAYGFPEVSLFTAEKVGERTRILRAKGLTDDGLPRLVAQLRSGRQTPATVAEALRWLSCRQQMRCVDLYRELMKLVAPRTVVDKSPVTVLRSEYLLRARRGFPEARYLHLVRHPRTNCASLARIPRQRSLAIGLDAFDYATSTPVIDFQHAWLRLHANIVNFLGGVPDHQKLRVRAEDLVGDPDGHLMRIARWLGWSTAESAVDSMKHPEDSPFARLGPWQARLGNDPGFLRHPAIRRRNGEVASLDGPLPWRADRRGFTQEVKDLAHEFGYD
jgi:hypothetical protein